MPASLELRVALFAERRDGHAGLVAAALARRSARAEIVSLRDCGVASAAPFGIDIPGFADALPDGAFVRGVPAGSFEQVTLRLGVLHGLRELGVTVWNDARAIEACIDKAMTSHLIAKAGLPTPATWTAQSLAAARAIAARETAGGAVLVLKPLFGSQGRGLRLIRDVADLPPEDEVAGVYYLQRFVEPEGDAWRDYRVFVCAGRAVAGMARTGSSWITNIHQGAAPSPLILGEEMRWLAVEAARVAGADYAGVDLIRSAARETLVLEVNSMPAWTGLQEAHPALDVAQIVADQFIAAMLARRPARPLAGGG